jgi:hypothetical protein
VNPAGEVDLAQRISHQRDRRRGKTRERAGLYDNARAWATVLLSPSWWRLDRRDGYPHWSGVALALWSNRQVRLSGLCATCWMQENCDDVRPCEGGDCRTFTRLLEQLAEVER